jgi:hypothetical protein
MRPSCLPCFLPPSLPSSVIVHVNTKRVHWESCVACVEGCQERKAGYVVIFQPPNLPANPFPATSTDLTPQIVLFHPVYVPWHLTTERITGRSTKSAAPVKSMSNSGASTKKTVTPAKKGLRQTYPAGPTGLPKANKTTQGHMGYDIFSQRMP